jgi:hypothetical protein
MKPLPLINPHKSAVMSHRALQDISRRFFAAFAPPPRIVVTNKNEAIAALEESRESTDPAVKDRVARAVERWLLHCEANE